VATVHAADEVFAFEQSGNRSVRQGDWKIVWDRARPEGERRWQLFNLAADPAEQEDLSEAEPERLAQLMAAWDRYDEQNGVIY
jgi:arylsulfatase A-like enzyme